MRVLLDHCVDRRFGRSIEGHEVVTAAEMGWDTLKNGALLRAAADGGFGAVVTVDRNLEHQQNPQSLPVSVVVLIARRSSLAFIVKCAPAVRAALLKVEAALTEGRRVVLRAAAEEA